MEAGGKTPAQTRSTWGSTWESTWGGQVDTRVDLGVDLPGRAQVTWVHLVGFSGCVLKAGRNLMALIYSRVNLMA